MNEPLLDPQQFLAGSDLHAERERLLVQHFAEAAAKVHDLPAVAAFHDLRSRLQAAEQKLASAQSRRAEREAALARGDDATGLADSRALADTLGSQAKRLQAELPAARERARQSVADMMRRVNLQAAGRFEGQYRAAFATWTTRAELVSAVGLWLTARHLAVNHGHCGHSVETAFAGRPAEPVAA